MRLLLLLLLLSACPAADRTRQNAIKQIATLVDQQEKDDAECVLKMAAAKSKGDVRFACMERRAAMKARYTGLLTMVPSPREDEIVLAWPAVPEEIEDAPEDDDGKRLLFAKGCLSCHTLDGTKLVGNSFKGLAGSTIEHTDGSSAVVDDAYLREAILFPDRKHTKGFVPTMAKVEMSKGSLDLIVAYLLTLSAPSTEKEPKK